MRKLINLQKPLEVDGEYVRLLGLIHGIRIVVEHPKCKEPITYDTYGDYVAGPFIGPLFNAPATKVYTLDIYPSTGMIYRRNDRRTARCDSSYPDMFSVIITELDGKVIKREFI